MGEFVFRDARVEDREEIRALAEAASEGEDYVGWVFEEWVSDAVGRFLVAVEEGSGRIAAIDKLTFLSLREAWFEGLRVHPDFQGRGLYTSLERHMIGEARRLGAEVIRFLTRDEPSAVHRNAYRHGFKLRFVVSAWKWTLKSERRRSGLSGLPQIGPLRAASAHEAPQLYEWWRRTASYEACGGLLNRGWSFSETTAGEWRARAERGDLFVPEGVEIREALLPPPLALVSQEFYDGAVGPEWVISTFSATGHELHSLLDALVGEARARNIGEIHAVLPDTFRMHTAMMHAAFEPVARYSAMALFEQVFDREQNATPG